MRKPSVFTALLVALLIAASGSGATLSINADKALYAPGEVVTLTVVGNSGGATDDALFGQIVFDPAGLLDPHAITFTPQSGGPAGWLAGYLGCPDPLGTPGTCWLINYIEDQPLQGATMDPIEQTLAIVTATAGAPGSYSVNWSGAESYGNELDFFGLTEGPGATLIIFNTSFQVVPEPATVLLVVLGVIALALRVRARSRCA
jgi:PEP-CTERM motif